MFKFHSVWGVRALGEKEEVEMGEAREEQEQEQEQEQEKGEEDGLLARKQRLPREGGKDGEEVEGGSGRNGNAGAGAEPPGLDVMRALAEPDSDEDTAASAASSPDKPVGDHINGEQPMERDRVGELDAEDAESSGNNSNSQNSESSLDNGVTEYTRGLCLQGGARTKALRGLPRPPLPPHCDPLTQEHIQSDLQYVQKNIQLTHNHLFRMTQKKKEPQSDSDESVTSQDVLPSTFPVMPRLSLKWPPHWQGEQDAEVDDGRQLDRGVGFEPETMIVGGVGGEEVDVQETLEFFRTVERTRSEVHNAEMQRERLELLYESLRDSYIMRSRQLAHRRRLEANLLRVLQAMALYSYRQIEVYHRRNSMLLDAHRALHMQRSKLQSVKQEQEALRKLIVHLGGSPDAPPSEAAVTAGAASSSSTSSSTSATSASGSSSSAHNGSSGRLPRALKDTVQRMVDGSFAMYARLGDESVTVTAGQALRTPYGRGTILKLRSCDAMAQIALDFGATLYMPLAAVLPYLELTDEHLQRKWIQAQQRLRMSSQDAFDTRIEVSAYRAKKEEQRAAQEAAQMQLEEQRGKAATAASAAGIDTDAAGSAPSSAASAGSPAPDGTEDRADSAMEVEASATAATAQSGDRKRKRENDDAGEERGSDSDNDGDDSGDGKGEDNDESSQRTTSRASSRSGRQSKASSNDDEDDDDADEDGDGTSAARPVRTTRGRARAVAAAKRAAIEDEAPMASRRVRRGAAAVALASAGLGVGASSSSSSSSSSSASSSSASAARSGPYDAYRQYDSTDSGERDGQDGKRRGVDVDHEGGEDDGRTESPADDEEEDDDEQEEVPRYIRARDLSQGELSYDGYMRRMTLPCEPDGLPLVLAPVTTLPDLVRAIKTSSEKHVHLCAEALEMAPTHPDATLPATPEATRRELRTVRHEMAQLQEEIAQTTASHRRRLARVRRRRLHTSQLTRQAALLRLHVSTRSSRYIAALNANNIEENTPLPDSDVTASLTAGGISRAAQEDDAKNQPAHAMRNIADDEEEEEEEEEQAEKETDDRMRGRGRGRSAADEREALTLRRSTSDAGNLDMSALGAHGPGGDDEDDEDDDDVDVDGGRDSATAEDDASQTHMRGRRHRRRRRPAGVRSAAANAAGNDEDEGVQDEDEEGGSEDDEDDEDDEEEEDDADAAGAHDGVDMELLLTLSRGFSADGPEEMANAGKSVIKPSSSTGETGNSGRSTRGQRGGRSTQGGPSKRRGAGRGASDGTRDRSARSVAEHDGQDGEGEDPSHDAEEEEAGTVEDEEESGGRGQERDSSSEDSNERTSRSTRRGGASSRGRRRGGRGAARSSQPGERDQGDLDWVHSMVSADSAANGPTEAGDADSSRGGGGRGSKRSSRNNADEEQDDSIEDFVASLVDFAGSPRTERARAASGARRRGAEGSTAPNGGTASNGRRSRSNAAAAPEDNGVVGAGDQQADSASAAAGRGGAGRKKRQRRGGARSTDEIVEEAGDAADTADAIAAELAAELGASPPAAAKKRKRARPGRR